MPDELEERLKSHARAFDSLLSLIPAKLYYGEDVSDQWKRKKQTPEQKRAAKMAKLDPDNWKSAKDVMDERSAALKKRKREEQEEDPSDVQLVEPEKPKSEQDRDSQKTKKRKTNSEPPSASTKSPEDENEKANRRSEQQAAKKERKKEKKAKAREKLERQQARKKEGKNTAVDAKGQIRKTSPAGGLCDEAGDGEMAEAIDLDKGTASVLNTSVEDETSSSEVSEDDQPEVFSPLAESGTSSISSIQPPTLDSISKPAAKPSLLPSALPKSSPDSQTPKERLQAAISAFRAERKADTSTGPKNRQELLEQRRQQEERRRAEKKEQKRREKEEEARREDEEIAKRFSPGGSGSLLASPRSPLIDTDHGGAANNFSFGRIAFDDGTQFDQSASTSTATAAAAAVGAHKKKGPSDLGTALKAAQAKHSRLSGLDADKRSTIEQKDMWLNARKRAAGEKVKDDTSLLKKALKRHEGQKKKSEKEWTERQEGIQKSIEMKQKKRTENLARRKDEKNSKGGGGKKGKKVKRPGFEGSFRGRTGGENKKKQ